MRHSSTMFLAVLAVGSAGCTNDLRAPSNYLVADDSTDESTGAAMLMVDCGAPPLTAVGATFAHTATAMGGDDNYTFAFANEDDIPAGLSIDPATGAISGVPVADGQFVFGIVATDGAGATGEAMCTVDVNPRLAVALEIEAPGCLRDSQSLLDLVVEGTGDGTEILCAAPGGRGNGRIPEGHSIDETACDIAGTFDDDAFGTWVFMVRGTQSGVDVWVPFCVINDDPGDSYDVNVAHSGEPDNTFMPMIGTFPATGAFALGDAMDPHFTAEDPDACAGGGACSFGFTFSYTATNFTDTDLDDLVVGAALLPDDMDEPIGMMHDLIVLEGSDIDEAFRDRPWALAVEFRYCVSNTTRECDGAENINANAGARFHFSVLMFPDSL